MNFSLDALLGHLKNRSIQTIGVLLLYVFVADTLPAGAHQMLYTMSVFLKDCLIWMMPLTVTFFLAKSVQGFGIKAPLFVATLILFEFLSNFSSVWYAYGAAKLVQPYLPVLKLSHMTESLQILWKIPVSPPRWWSAEKGALVGVLLGSVTAFSQNPQLLRLLKTGHQCVQWGLTKIFARFIPLFIVGFAAQMHQTHLLSHIIGHYSLLVLCLLGFLIFYLVFLFALGAGWSFYKAVLHMRSLMTAGSMALTSGCSISTMPWTIEGAGKNLDDPALAQALIPATTNIQQIGDCITNSFLCALIYSHFYGTSPDIITFAIFSGVFVLARFSTAAVLGGAIFIMLPIYETYLNFTPEMIAIILALNVFLDPFVTSSNVVANGALCRVFEIVWQRVTRRQPTLAKPA